MNKIFFTTILLCTTIFSIQAQQSKDDLNSARKDLNQAKLDLKQARKDSIAEYKQFKKESESKIVANDKAIVALKAQHIAYMKEANAKYDKKVEDLQQRNKDLHDKVINYKADGNTNWVVFKRQFAAEMDALQKSFSESREE